MSSLIRLNSLISKHTHSHHLSLALQVFHQIHSSHHFKPDQYSFASTLTACANLCDTTTGNQLHSLIIHTGYKSYPHVTNTLLSLYAKSNDFNSLHKSFDEIITPDDYSWTTLLSAHAKSGRIDYALNLFAGMPKTSVAVWNAVVTGCIENSREGTAFEMFQEMHQMGVRHDHYTFASVLSLCCSWGLLDFGRQLHSLVIRTGFLAKVSVVNAQLTMYFNCELVSDAYQLFQEATSMTCNEITYNAMIAGLVSLGRDVEAFMIFKEMREICFEPTQLTFTSVLSACASAKMIKLGKQVHVQAIKVGFATTNAVSNAAITMYSNCGEVGAACFVFEMLKDKDLVSWNSIIACHAQGHSCKSAIMEYSKMQMAGIKPDEFTVGSLLSFSELGITEMIHALVDKTGLIFYIEVGNALVCAYSTHSQIKHAYQIFCDMSWKNLISWNSIISGYLYNEMPVKGMVLFNQLQRFDLKPNSFTLSNALSACTSMLALGIGKQLHGLILRFGFSLEASLGNALITMYAKCGLLELSSKVFYGMSERDIVSWNSIIAAYGQHGEGKEAIGYFEAMRKMSSIKPDKVTFIAVLTACSHAGLVAEGRQIFSSMVKDHGIEPGMDHYSCIIDLLGRAGHLDEAEGLINAMLFKADSTIWWALLSACRAWGNVRLGKIAAEHLLNMEQDNNSAVYALLSNLYAAAGQWQESAEVREVMSKNGVMKQPGYSWV